jgi:hypothetical protein
MYGTIKSKSVFIVLFFALLLNISHDLVIAHEMKIESNTNLYLGATNYPHSDASKNMSELHEIFHFSAILSSFINMDFPYVITSKLLFIPTILPTSIQQSTFKPPIA